MARETRTDKAKAATAKADEQDSKVKKAGGDPKAVAPDENPAVDSNYTEAETAARKADAKDSPVDLHHEESTKEQLPAKEQLTGTGAPNGDDAAVESDDVDSAGEQKSAGETKPKASDTAVVTGAVQQQKAVGALASEKSPKGQNLTAIAESPVSTPNGERVVTYTTPPRVGVVDPASGVPEEGETGVISEEDRARGNSAGFNQTQGGGQNVGTNGTRAGLETVNSGIIPDPTVAETDGTYMPGGAPNETFDSTVAPEGDYVGAQLNAAPLDAPEPRQYAGGDQANTPAADVGLRIAAAPANGSIVDEETGKKPSGDLFVPLYEHGSIMVSTKRLIEKTSDSSGQLLLHKGAQISAVQAEQIKARVDAS